MMENRFKFREYSKNLKCMFYYDVTSDMSNYNPAFHILMQCLGLKDRNGKLIYENDIVRYKFKNREFGQKDYVYVIPDKMEFGLDGGLYGWDITDDTEETLEVIGNKFEHPHLLENQ